MPAIAFPFRAPSTEADLGHGAGTLLLIGGTSFDTGDDKGEAEPRPKVVGRASDFISASIIDWHCCAVR